MTFPNPEFQSFDPNTVEPPPQVNLGTLQEAEITDPYDPARPFEYELDAEDLQRVWEQRWNADNSSLDISDLNQRQRADVIYYLQTTIADDELGAQARAQSARRRRGLPVLPEPATPTPITRAAARRLVCAGATDKEGAWVGNVGGVALNINPYGQYLPVCGVNGIDTQHRRGVVADALKPLLMELADKSRQKTPTRGKPDNDQQHITPYRVPTQMELEQFRIVWGDLLNSDLGEQDLGRAHRAIYGTPDDDFGYWRYLVPTRGLQNVKNNLTNRQRSEFVGMLTDAQRLRALGASAVSGLVESERKLVAPTTNQPGWSIDKNDRWLVA